MCVSVAVLLVSPNCFEIFEFRVIFMFSRAGVCMWLSLLLSFLLDCFLFVFLQRMYFQILNLCMINAMDLSTQSGKTALDWAKNNDHADVARLIEVRLVSLLHQPHFWHAFSIV